ncbi:hypothetical protein DICPUDRAFT_41225, partial [Dictyostelium purpureum]
KLIKSGNLLKKGKINKSWQKRWCILSKESKLFYHKSPTEKHCGLVDLNQCIIKKSECTEKEYIFEINTSNRIFLFSAETKSEMEDWMRKIYTHSKIQKENDLLERAEYIIRDQALWKSNLEDEFLKLKHAFNPYIFNQSNNSSNNNNNNNSNNITTPRKNSTNKDDDIDLYNYIPLSLLSFGFHNQTDASSSPSLSHYNSLSTKQLYNHFNSIIDHEYKHPLILINNNNNNNGGGNGMGNSINITNILNNNLNTIRTRSHTTHNNSTSPKTSNKEDSKSNIVNGDKAATSRRFSFLGLKK